MTLSDGGAVADSAAAKPLRVLLLLAHPRRDSLCAALADAYAAGAATAGVTLRRCDIAALQFDPNVTHEPIDAQPCEPDIRAAMQDIAWANHLVFVFPTWWGTMPALLKGFLDRVLLPGFAFAFRPDSDDWDKLLAGRSAHLLTTMDTPSFVYRWIYRAPGLNGLAKATLGFCGIAPVRRTIFGPVRSSQAGHRAGWIAQAHAAGASLRHGAVPRGLRIRRQVGTWLAAMRLQFYPMAWLAYLMGALAAWQAGRPVQGGAFWLGLLCLVSLEAATVFANDYFDRPSDSINRQHGPFTGGSRMLVDGRLSPARMRLGIAVALGVFALAGLALVSLTPWVMLPFLLGNAVLALGYTVPPLKLCWRGLGEIDVALTHSFAVLLCGSLAQGAPFTAAFPWLIGLPLYCSVLPAIILSGLPDYAADRAAGKRSLAVARGPQNAALIAAVAALLAALTSPCWVVAFGTPALFPILLLVLPGATLLLKRIAQYRAAGAVPRRIDRLMVLSLSFSLLFVGAPLVLLLLH
jgi:putative NADPH-quinone reductase/1,4-dihydroxy-2-naphthoate octaprenyltransferase